MKSLRLPIMAGVVAILLILVAGWFLLVSPRLAEAADLAEQTQTAQDTALSLEGQIAALKKQAAELPLQQRRLRTSVRRCHRRSTSPA